ncbi:hypothetical protein BOW50_11905 [Solemya velum gill symbiont]|uniref:lipase family alpha/beta hydrolase n=1 Tax=Solemya velum gill symbiont TaxID=2340 RepID=UPI000997F25F|nr:alpha/beta fold hydrolase [Solemya velum gill symbiont]OOZ75383.1 hypothetical protein BOW50_11905 [Solemya velum gill symbiont]
MNATYVKQALLLLTLLLPLGTARAEVIVFVHGYMGSANSWTASDITSELGKAGWVHVGLPATSDQPKADKSFYTVELPSLAPVTMQAGWLKSIVDEISRNHPEENLTLVGHSAGGVVSRLMLIQHGIGQVERLITIATPHLGTDRAIQALQATDNSGMFGSIKKWAVKRKVGNHIYNTLQHSRPLLANLAPPVPGTLLYWLNNQQHPDIEYISIVRSGSYNFAGDLLVPSFSQDMNWVPALQGKSQVLVSVHGHELSPADSFILLELL